MAKYKAYPEYKDSGVEWLGEIPLHWQLKRLGIHFIERKDKVSDKKYQPLSVTKEGIVPQIETAAKTEAGDNRKLVMRNDFVINSRSDRKGSAGVSKLNGSVSLISIVMRPQNILPEYVHHLLRSYSFQEEFYRFGKGIVADLWSTNSSEMKNIIIPIPTEKECKLIATFIDHELIKIDTLIEKQKLLIALLKEKRQALISHIVTKGLNPDTPLKDSGIEWLGKIPQHWRISKLRYCFSFGKGLTITKENLQEEGIPCINYGEIHSKYGFEVNPKIHHLKCVSESYKRGNLESLLSFGDLIFADTSEDLAGSGNFSQLVCEANIFAGYHTIIVRPERKKNYRYYAYIMDGPAFRTQVQYSVKGVKVFSITQSLLRGLTIWLPPDNEQARITAFLDNKTAKIDTLIQKQLQQIELLKERRTALIAAAVTGKIDLRDWAPPAISVDANLPAEEAIA